MEAHQDSSLSSFREQWQQELLINEHQKKPANIPPTLEKTETIIQLSNEDQAKKLFLKGVEHEQSGELYDAIKFYKRAVQLVPDIEFKLYDSSKQSAPSSTTTTASCTTEKPAHNLEKPTIDLVPKLSKIITKNQCLCFPQVHQNSGHVSSLPAEMIVYILRWVVSSELDLFSLESISRVCRGFYVSARDQEIWRLACARVWGVRCGNFAPEFSSYREMFLNRPRVNFNGCYISKTTYIRHGENSFQDTFYRPWHLVEYFRYLRFFPEGRVLMLTSTDSAQACVNALRNRNPKGASTILVGHYRLCEEEVTLVLKRERSKGWEQGRSKAEGLCHSPAEQTFHMELSIQNYRKKRNSQLSWLRYTILTKSRNSQVEGGTTSLISCNKYPPFRFSRVKSYTQESTSPL